MKLALILLFISSIIISAQKINTNEIFDIIKNYPQHNYIGAFGSSDMKPVNNGALLRDFGVYKKSKIRIVPENINDKIINVVGRLFIFNDLENDFKGQINISKIEHSYESNNNLDEKGNVVKDSILIKTIDGEFQFMLQNKKIYKGNIVIHLEQNSNKEWNLAKSGIILYGTYDNKSLNFGNITPPSSGIFRLNPADYSKNCINKNLLKFGWETYILSKPDYFNCTFDSLSDKIEYLLYHKGQIEKNLQVEENELK